MVVRNYREKLSLTLDILVGNDLEARELVDIAVVCDITVDKKCIKIIVFIVCLCNSISELCRLFEPVASDAGGSFKMRVAACDKTNHRGELGFILGCKAPYEKACYGHNYCCYRNNDSGQFV